jgi:hypothetical protein
MKQEQRVFEFQSEGNCLGIPSVIGGFEGAQQMELFCKRIIYIACFVGTGFEFRQFGLDWWLDDSGFGFRQGQEIFVLSETSRPSLGPTQFPIQLILMFFHGGKAIGA